MLLYFNINHAVHSVLPNEALQSETQRLNRYIISEGNATPVIPEDWSHAVITLKDGVSKISYMPSKV
jgi:hypothetical protein